jgi:hypothetical protein
MPTASPTRTLLPLLLSPLVAVTVAANGSGSGPWEAPNSGPWE